MRRVLMIIAVLLAIFLVACAVEQPQATSPRPSSETSFTAHNGKLFVVTIEGDYRGNAHDGLLDGEEQFIDLEPAVVTVRKGDTVQWVNTDFRGYTIRFDNGMYSVYLPSGGMGQYTFNTAGTYAYAAEGDIVNQDSGLYSTTQGLIVVR